MTRQHPGGVRRIHIASRKSTSGPIESVGCIESCFPRTRTSHNEGNLSKARWKRRSKQKLRKTFRRLLLLVDSSKFWVPSRVPKIDQILDIVRFPRSQKNGDAGVASFSIFDAKPAATNFFIDCSLMWVSQIDFFWFR